MAIHTLEWRTTIHFGRGALGRLPDVLRSLSCSSPLVLLGQGSVRRAGHLRRVERLLEEFSPAYHEGIAPNPTAHHLAAAAEAIREHRPDCVVALGGGSVIDIAKSAQAVASQWCDLEKFLTGQLIPKRECRPCVAIPTTAGTGSEATSWATIWEPERNRKSSLEGPTLAPVFALIDPELTVSLPPHLTASCGLDTFSQAVEAFWATGTQPCSQALSLSAIELVLSSLPVAVSEPNNLDAREAVSWACTLTALSFSQTRTTAAHAFSYPLTLRFGILHGIACALSIPALLEFNSEPCPSAYAPLFAAFGFGTARDAARRIRAFYESVGVAPRLSAHGVPHAALEEIARSALASPRSLNNPRPLSLSEAMKLLDDSF